MYKEFKVSRAQMGFHLLWVLFCYPVFMLSSCAKLTIETYPTNGVNRTTTNPSSSTQQTVNPTPTTEVNPTPLPTLKGTPVPSSGPSGTPSSPTPTPSLAPSTPPPNTPSPSPSSSPNGPSGMNNSSKLYVGYFESWADPSAASLANVPSYYNVVNLAFLQPDMSYTKGSFDLSKSGFDFKTTSAQTLKSSIAALRAKGTRVIVSIGGWCFSVDGDATCTSGGVTPSTTRWAYWDPNDSRYSQSKVSGYLQSIKNFVDDFGLDGVDIDFETNGYPSTMFAAANCSPSNGGGTWVPPGTSLTQVCKADPQYINIVNTFRAAFPRPYLVTAAVHGYGAYGEGIYSNAVMTPGWGGAWWNGGMSVGMLKASGTQLDFLNVMSYDANTYFNPLTNKYEVNPNDNNVNVGFYDPTTALLAYQSYFKGPVVMGVETPAEGSPKETSGGYCQMGHCLTLAELNYLLNFINQNNGGGLMLWAIQKTPNTGYSNYPDPNAISKAACTAFGFGNCTQTFPLPAAVPRP